MAGMHDMGVNELRARLEEFDRAVALRFPGRSFRLVIVGGGAMVLMGVLSRATSDLDALHFPRELLPLMEEFDLSGLVTAYEDQFAYNMEDRLVRLDVTTSTVDCYTASLEDLIASKLYSDRPVDETDVRRPEVLAALNWDRLATVAEDMEASSLIERRFRQFLGNYTSYREEYGPSDD